MRFLLLTCDFTLFQFNFSPLSIFSSFYIIPIRFLCFLFDSFLPQSSFSRFYSFSVPISLASSSQFLPPFPPPHACDSSFTQFQLSLQTFDFLLVIPPPHLRFLFTYCRLKQSPCPKFLQHSSFFTLSTPVLISQSDLFSTPLNEVLHEKISKTRKIPRK